LNDTLVAGPSLYLLLSSVLNRLRLHKLAVTANISKMFREVELDGRDCDLHNFLMENDGQIKDWRMKRVTFGVHSSPCLASRVLRQMAKEYSAQYPSPCMGR